ncbi:MAG: thioesterase [bacterium]
MKYSEVFKRDKKKFNLYETLDIFQNAAVAHGTRLGFGYEEMLEKDVFWVLLRTKFVVYNNSETDEYTSITYPKEPSKINFNREYQIKHNDEVLIDGISKWLVVSLQTRKIKRDHNLIYHSKTIDESLFEDIYKISYDLDKFKLVDTYQVTDKDLDRNNHVNNASYAFMIEKIINTENIKEFQIDYLNEILNNQKIDLFTYKENETLFILGKFKDKICFVSEIKGE